MFIGEVLSDPDGCVCVYASRVREKLTKVGMVGSAKLVLNNNSPLLPIWP